MIEGKRESEEIIEEVETIEEVEDAEQSPVIKIVSEVPEGFYEHKGSASVDEVVKGILDDVKEKGDEALSEYSSALDHIDLTSFAISSKDIMAANRSLRSSRPKLYSALSYSRSLVMEFSKRQKECYQDFEAELVPGLLAGQRVVPVERAGIYVPAGRYPLLSTVIMCATPARAAGVKEVVMCTPPKPHPTATAAYADEGIMAAASIAGVDKVFAVGGAQAIGAMAFGTKTVPKCDVIVGPGNAFVAEAKRQVAGFVGIDMVAGPTEVMIIADDTAAPAWVAADMLAQAEHDIEASAVLLTPSTMLAHKVAHAIRAQLELLPTARVAAKSLEHALIIITGSLDEAVTIANRKAPEHLELSMAKGAVRANIEKQLFNYGSLFIGSTSAEVLGDYAAGINHTLPTGGAARYTGGLSVRTFLKCLTTVRTAQDVGYARSLKAAATIAGAEGLAAHQRAAEVRLR